MTKPLAFIIEDDPDLNLIFGTSLKEAGFHTQSFYNGSDALKRMTTDTPHVITLDLHLPKMSGKEFLKEIRTRNEFNGIHVILTTADPHMASSLQSLVDHILIKPISFIQLRDVAIRFKP